MALQYSKIKTSEAVLISLTGLTLPQFEKLLIAFEQLKKSTKNK